MFVTTCQKHCFVYEINDDQITMNTEISSIDNCIAVEISENKRFVYVSEERKNIFRFALNLQEEKIVNLDSRICLNSNFKTYFDSSFDVSNNGQLLLTALTVSKSPTFLINPKRQRRTLVCYLDRNMRCLRIAHRANLFFASGIGNIIHYEDIRSLKMIHKSFQFDSRVCYSMRVSPNGKLLALGTQQNRVFVYQIRNNIKLILRNEFTFRASVFTLCFGPESEYLFAGGRKKKIERYCLISEEESVEENKFQST